MYLLWLTVSTLHLFRAYNKHCFHARVAFIEMVTVEVGVQVRASKKQPTVLLFYFPLDLYKKGGNFRGLETLWGTFRPTNKSV